MLSVSERLNKGLDEIRAHLHNADKSLVCNCHTSSREIEHIDEPYGGPENDVPELMHNNHSCNLVEDKKNVTDIAIIDGWGMQPMEPFLSQPHTKGDISIPINSVLIIRPVLDRLQIREIDSNENDKMQCTCVIMQCRSGTSMWHCVSVSFETLL